MSFDGMLLRLKRGDSGQLVGAGEPLGAVQYWTY